MKNLTYIFGLVVLALSMSACQDLAVDNENSPDRARVLAEPVDVETLISDTFANNWESRQACASGALFLSTIADENSSSWANWGMRDMASEPRIAWDNNPAYSRASSTEQPWFDAYRAISNANDGLIAIANAEAEGAVGDNIFTDAGLDVERLKGFAKFNQAWAHAWIAMLFDQGFIVDENVDLEQVALGAIELNLVPYTDVLDAAIAQMDEAIAIFQANPDIRINAAEDWIFGIDMTAEDMVRLGNSFKAQWLASVGRSVSERDAADWNQIRSLIAAGITQDFTPIGDDDGDIEWDCLKFYGQNGTTWSRMDYRTVGAADEAGGYDNWLASPLEERFVFDIVTNDRRIVGNVLLDEDGVPVLDEDTGEQIIVEQDIASPDYDPTVWGKYTQYQGTNGPFPASRGVYHYGSHNHRRYQDYNLAGANGPMPFMILAEMDMLHAEALLRTGGDLQLVAELINNTRVPNGELNPATAGDPVGASSDAHSHLDGASLWAKMKYEKRIEAFQTSAGLAYFDDRGWGELVTGTPIHFPVPGAELQTLGLQLYTFGGVGGEGAAPKTGFVPANEPEHNARTR